jgi:hypothetical protein
MYRPQIDFMERGVKVIGDNLPGRRAQTYSELFLQAIMLVELVDLSTDRWINAIVVGEALRVAQIPYLNSKKGYLSGQEVTGNHSEVIRKKREIRHYVQISPKEIGWSVYTKDN